MVFISNFKFTKVQVISSCFFPGTKDSVYQNWSIRLQGVVDNVALVQVDNRSDAAEYFAINIGTEGEAQVIWNRNHSGSPQQSILIVEGSKCFEISNELVQVKNK